MAFYMAIKSIKRQAHQRRARTTLGNPHDVRRLVQRWVMPSMFKIRYR